MKARATQYAHALWAGKGLVSTLLLPLSWSVALYIWCKRRYYRRHPEQVCRSSHPVIVVGNLFVGGTGKTPVVLAIVQALQAHGWTPGIISRGYGAASRSTSVRHGKGILDPAHFGDEPSLIAAQTGAPVAVHRLRARALHALEQYYPDVDVIVSDDGLQHLALGRDVEIIVQDSRGCGNGRLLPAGPLRELAQRLHSADFLITQQDAPATTQATPTPQGNTSIHMTLRPESMHHLRSGRRLTFGAWCTRYGNAPVSAVAAIGTPQRFFRMLQQAGLQLHHCIALPDHDTYQHPPFAQLPQAPILITPKDAVKCTALNDERLWVVHPRTVFSDPDWLNHLHAQLQQVHRQKNAVHNTFGAQSPVPKNP